MNFSSNVNQLTSLAAGGTALAWLMPDQVMGVSAIRQGIWGAWDARHPDVRLISAGRASALALSTLSAGATSRIKDLANIEGVRQNQLIGYGLVVGLNGTGDTLNNIPFTKQSLQAMLERMGVNIRGATIRTGNVAAVMVTGNLPAFGTQGTRMDVTVSALGDAKNLQGGTLLVTPLLGADGNVYAVAQGSVAIGGFAAEGQAASVTKGVPTVGRIANGAIIEREIEFALNRLPNVRLALRNADFTTAKRIAAAVNDFLGVKTAEPIDPSTVQLSIPAEFKGNVVAFLTEIEQLQVDPDLAAKIVIDERSGIIVMGRDVRVATVAVAQGNLTVTISESPQVSQPQSVLARTNRGHAALERRRHRGRQEARGGQGRRLAAAARRRPQRPRHRPARPDRHLAGDQGRRRDPGRHRGDVMRRRHQASPPTPEPRQVEPPPIRCSIGRACTRSRRKRRRSCAARRRISRRCSSIRCFRR